MLDNHDDFGGHAKRNEFTLDGRLVIGYAGSQSIQSPRSMWKTAAKRLLRDLHVDVTRFETAFDRSLYGSLGLSRGLFFNREAFGRDAQRCAVPHLIVVPCLLLTLLLGPLGLLAYLLLRGILNRGGWPLFEG